MRNLATLVAPVLVLAACAEVPKDPIQRAVYDETNDPLEPMNRAIFDFNIFLDDNALKPAAQAYRFVLPDGVRTVFRNFLSNMSEPVRFVNQVLQGEMTRAGITVSRMFVNSTAGLLGTLDVASDPAIGLTRQPGDFGQTLWVYGVDAGPYLMLPILGPSSPRDAVGNGVDGAMDPFTLGADSLAFSASRFLSGGLDQREQVLDSLDSVRSTSVDFYASIRSLYRQNREAELRGDRAAPLGGGSLYVDPATPAAR